LSYGPVNMTNNDIWGGWNELNIPHIYSPNITATDDNRFYLTWYQGIEASDNDWVSNIAYAINDTTGIEIKPPTILTDDVVGAPREYSNPAVEGISNQQALVAFLREENNANDLFFVVLDSNGNTIKSMTNLSNDDSLSTEIGVPDIAQFSNGNIAVAWNTMNDTRFAVLDAIFNRIADPISLSHPAMRSFYWPVTYLSLAADTTGHVALTWGDPDRNNARHLYYALLNDDSSVQIPPMIFLTPDYRIMTGAQGYSSTSYTFNPSTPGVDTNIQAPFVNIAPPNRTTSIPIKFGNNGASLATSVTITATLSDGLFYFGDDSGIQPTLNTISNMPSVEGSQYTWNFSKDMAFLGSGKFNLLIGIGNVDIGTTYPLTITISSAEIDDIIGNNTFVLNVEAGQLTYLPILRR
jgi:hypothetical protein